MLGFDEQNGRKIKRVNAVQLEDKFGDSSAAGCERERAETSVDAEPKHGPQYVTWGCIE